MGRRARGRGGWRGKTIFRHRGRGRGARRGSAGGSVRGVGSLREGEVGWKGEETGWAGEWEKDKGNRKQNGGNERNRIEGGHYDVIEVCFEVSALEANIILVEGATGWVESGPDVGDIPGRVFACGVERWVWRRVGGRGRNESRWRSIRYRIRGIHFRTTKNGNLQLLKRAFARDMV